MILGFFTGKERDPETGLDWFGRGTSRRRTVGGQAMIGRSRSKWFLRQTLVIR